MAAEELRVGDAAGGLTLREGGGCGDRTEAASLPPDDIATVAAAFGDAAPGGTGRSADGFGVTGGATAGFAGADGGVGCGPRRPSAVVVAASSGGAN